ncbi:MAG: ATP-binding protein [Fuerstiella sp.]
MLEDLKQHQCELQQQNEELQRTHNELNKATEKFRDLWNHAPVGYVSHDCNGQILEANERARLMLGAGGAVDEESTLQRFLTPHSRQVLRQHLWMAAEADNAVAAELMLESTSQSVQCWLRMETTSSSGDEFRSALVDISALKRAEAERLELANQLRQSQKMEVLHELSAGIAHDFNNILQVVIAYGELVRTDLAADGKNTSDIQSLISGAERGADLTRRLLAFSRKSSLEATPTDLRQIVTNAATVVKRTVDETIQVVANTASDPVPVEVDATLIEQAVMNLCLNARDAMPQGGKLTIRAHQDEVPNEILVNGCRLAAGRYAVISISDNGLGMKEAVVEKIFEPFFTTKKVGSGTGLGLSIVYGVIRQHSGAITVQSVFQRGSKFQIFLPLADAKLAPCKVETTPHVEPVRNQDGAILLAEDEASIREVMTKCLQLAGYRVRSVKDGREAIQLLSEGDEQFDLLLTDAVMPNASGKDVCRVFQSHFPSSSVMFLTGHGDGVIDRQFLAQNSATLLTKPVQSDVLLRAVASSIAANL